MMHADLIDQDDLLGQLRSLGFDVSSGATAEQACECAGEPCGRLDAIGKEPRERLVLRLDECFCTCADAIAFERLLAALPSEILPLVISYESTPAQDYDSLCTFVSALLPTLLQAREPFVLLGESFSGPIAVRVGALAPHCVGVVLVASFVRCPMRVPRWATRIAEPLRYLSAPSA